MKRALVVVATVAAMAFGVDVLGDLTQSRPDEPRDGSATELVLAVRVDRFRPGPDGAAAALWAVCSPLTHSLAGDLRPTEDGRYRVMLEPAVGDNERKKLVGCLEDLTIDRVRGDVVAFREVEATPGRAAGMLPAAVLADRT
jgi:hypothetical protein